MMGTFALWGLYVVVVGSPVLTDLEIKLEYEGRSPPTSAATLRIETIRPPHPTTKELYKKEDVLFSAKIQQKEIEVVLQDCIRLGHGERTCEQLRVSVSNGDWTGEEIIDLTAGKWKPAITVTMKYHESACLRCLPSSFDLACGPPACATSGCDVIVRQSDTCCESDPSTCGECGCSAPCLGEYGDAIGHSHSGVWLGARPSNSGKLTVQVPADATVFINGHRASKTGTHREYISLNLLPGETYNFVVRAEVVRDGRLLADTKLVVLRAGQTESLALDLSSDCETQVASRR